MAAWGYFRFICRGCGDAFWCRPTVTLGDALCHDCEVRKAAPDAPSAPPLAFRLKISDTAQHTHE